MKTSFDLLAFLVSQESYFSISIIGNFLGRQLSKAIESYISLHIRSHMQKLIYCYLQKLLCTSIIDTSLHTITRNEQILHK